MRVASTYIVLLYLVAMTAGAAPFTGVSYQTSCSDAGAPAVTGGSSCFSGPSGQIQLSSLPEFGLSYAAANASIATFIGGTSFSDIHATQTTSLGQGWAPPDSIHLPAVSATSEAQFGVYLTTAGPARDGLLQIVFTDRSFGNPSGGDGWGTFSVTFPGWESSLACGISWTPCSATMVANHFNALGGLGVPLGTPFFLNYDGIFKAYAGGFAEANESGTLDLDYQFRFLEADGVTPVAILSAAPEPGSFGMLGISLATAAFLWKQRPRQN